MLFTCNKQSLSAIFKRVCQTVTSCNYICSDAMAEKVARAFPAAYV